jgi:protein ImuB
MPPPLYLCLHLRNFAAQALTHRAGLRGRAVAVLSGAPPLESVFALTPQARQLGVEEGMSRVQAESFGIVLLRRERQREDEVFAELMHCAQRFSPRVEIVASPHPEHCDAEHCGATLMLDLTGSTRLFGSPARAAQRLSKCMAELQLQASIACSQQASAALLAARGREGVTVIRPGDEAATLAPLPIAVLEPSPEQAQSLYEWGIGTLGRLAELPARALASRMGEAGVRLQRQARGEHFPLLAPHEEPADAPLTESLELEHPVETLEPLLFLIGQMLESLLRRAASRALALAEVETALILDGPSHERDDARNHRREHRRLVRPTLPERERLTLLKLIQLDLELHPPEAAVIALRLTARPAPAQVVQHGLFAAQAPEAGRMEILLARLRKLVGEDRVGSPELLDTHAPEDFRVAAFAPRDAMAPHICPPLADVGSAGKASVGDAHTQLALRMVRPPRAVTVELRDDAPAALWGEGRRTTLQTVAGPWRSSGAWWTHPAWCREEWDVALRDEARQCLRLAHDPAAGCWYVIGIYD